MPDTIEEELYQHVVWLCENCHPASWDNIRAVASQLGIVAGIQGANREETRNWGVGTLWLPKRFGHQPIAQHLARRRIVVADVLRLRDTLAIVTYCWQFRARYESFQYFAPYGATRKGSAHLDYLVRCIPTKYFSAALANPCFGLVFSPPPRLLPSLARYGRLCTVKRMARKVQGPLSEP